MTRMLSAALAGALALSLAGAARADFPTFYFDEATFQAQGTIGQSTNFDAYGPDLTLLSNSESFGALTFSGNPLIVVGTDSYLHPVRNLITNNDPSQLTTIDVGAVGYNMLGFRAGNLISYGEQVFVELTTNVDTYAYGLYPGDAPETLSFYGFVVPLGEYFTGLQFNHTEVSQAFGLTDVQLGASTPPCNTSVCTGGGGVPEPSTWAVMILGLGLAGLRFRGRRRADTGALDA